MQCVDQCGVVEYCGGQQYQGGEMIEYEYDVEWCGLVVQGIDVQVIVGGCMYQQQVQGDQCQCCE